MKRKINNKLTEQRGFALIATVAILALVVMVSLAMVSLATSVARTESNSSAIDEARANARLALSEAIAELQRTTGPDSRITAPADIFEENPYITANNAHVRQLTGAWRSWEGLNHISVVGDNDSPLNPANNGLEQDDPRTIGLPVRPDYESKTKVYNPGNHRSGRFLRWLVSEQSGASRGNSMDPTDPPLLTESTGATITLLGEASVGTDPQNQVHVVPASIRRNSNVVGAKAWWVQGDNMKVQLRRTTKATEASDVLAQSSISPGPSGAEFGFNDLDEIEKAVTNKSLDLIDGANSSVSSDSFHDITTYSRGLMVNVANGGWKRDLSLFSEELSQEFSTQFWDGGETAPYPDLSGIRGDLPPTSAATKSAILTNIPALSLRPDALHLATKEGTVANPADFENDSPVIYPWSRNLKTNATIANWGLIADYMTDYKRRSRQSGSTDVSTYASDMNGGSELWATRIRRMPRVAVVQQILALSAVEEGGSYTPAIAVTPVVTMWNPYGVELDMSQCRESLYLGIKDGGFPADLNFSINGVEDPVGRDMGDIMATEKRNGRSYFKMPMHDPAIWAPGEVRIFSPQNTTFVNAEKGDDINLAVGYRPAGGNIFKLPDESEMPGTTEYRLTKARVGGSIISSPISDDDDDIDEDAENGIGFGYTFAYGGGTGSAPKKISPTTTGSAGTFISNVDQLRKNLGDWILSDDLTQAVAAPPAQSLADLAKNPQPFLACIQGLHFSQDVNKPGTQTFPIHNNIIINGIHNSSPPVGWKTRGNTSFDKERPDWDRYDGSYYTTLFLPVSGYNDANLPSGLSNESAGYIGNSFRSSDGGLSNIIMYDAPDRPIRTIVDLQHAPLNDTSNKPPYTLNAVGNSTASPFIDADKVRMRQYFTPTSDNFKRRGVHGADHCYATNHMLMDDWFVSTAGEDVDPWDSSSTTRSWEQVYRDFVSGTEELPNSYYKKSESAMDATDFTADPSVHWLRIAAELEVEGMFNINSTSTKAWQMLLKGNFGPNTDGNKILALDDQDRESSILTINAAQATPSVPLGKAFPRTKLTSSAQSGVTLGHLALTQPIRFNDVQIEGLAEEIVKEIKQRGPFLSLSEFFNRQLLVVSPADTTSTESHLARFGAVEAALTNLSNLPLTDPKNAFALLKKTFADPPSAVNAAGDPLTYPFGAAAQGNPAYGYPGWTRQADVLGPISGNITPRDDTFTIRAYGSSMDASGNVQAEAWCEAVVQRKAEYVDSSENKYASTVDDTLKSGVNKTFGRRYRLVRFRWLNANEI